jgi:hypothetical protein
MMVRVDHSAAVNSIPFIKRCRILCLCTVDQPRDKWRQDGATYRLPSFGGCRKRSAAVGGQMDGLVINHFFMKNIELL